MRKILLPLLIITHVLSSCAAVKFYSDKTLTTKTGLEFFAPKPYLVVEKNPSKDVVIKTTVIYLPDKNNPKYAEITPGLGSSDLKLALENGMITSYGISSDAKIPETISAITGLVTGGSSSFKSILEAINASKKSASGEAEQGADAEGMTKAFDMLTNVKKNLEKHDISEIQDKTLTSNQTSQFNAAKTTLKDILDTLNKKAPQKIPEIVKKMDALVSSLKDVIINTDSLSPIPEPVTRHNTLIKRLITEIKSSEDMISPPEPISSGAFSIYEIIIDASGTTLREVEVKR